MQLERHWSRLRERLAQPVDAASTVFFREIFGLWMLLDLSHYVFGDRIQQYFLEPSVLFKFYGFEWLAPWPEWGLRLHFAVLMVAAAGIAAGLLYRLCACVFFLGYSYVFLLDSALYNNHTYLICLLSFLMIFIPAHRMQSVDAWLRPQIRSRQVPSWALWLLRFQIGVPYFFGGIAKLNYDWIVLAQPMKLWLESGAAGGWLLDFEWLRHAWAAYFFCWAGLLFDLLIVPALLWRRTRAWAFAAAVFFHLTNSQIFDIGVFPRLMICATTIFFEPGWLWRFSRQRTESTPESVQGLQLPRFATALLCAWIVVQVALPFRHWLYPGNVDWTEEGHRFAWRMKIRDKSGPIQFVSHEPEQRRIRVHENLDAYLSEVQQKMMLQDPDMMRQFARFLAQRIRAESNAGPVAVHVRTQLSLNGHPPQPLVDPSVDLASLGASLLPSSWIVPYEAGDASKPGPVAHR